jgi:chondroitin 4-sulfotransferase 11
MIVSASRKFVFAHIPKTAGTSMTSALEPFADGQTAARLNTAHETLAEFFARRPEATGHFKFAFVRNPWERAVSFYFHARKRLAPTVPQMQAVETFEDMLRLLDEGVEWLRDLVSLRPQHAFVSGETGAPLADFIGRYERLNDDFAVVCNKVGIAAELPAKNRSDHEPYARYYSNWGRSFVAAHYRRDIDEFGYSFEARA